MPVGRTSFARATPHAIFQRAANSGGRTPARYAQQHVCRQRRHVVTVKSGHRATWAESSASSRSSSAAAAKCRQRAGSKTGQSSYMVAAAAAVAMPSSHRLGGAQQSRRRHTKAPRVIGRQASCRAASAEKWSPWATRQYRRRVAAARRRRASRRWPARAATLQKRRPGQARLARHISSASRPRRHLFAACRSFVGRRIVEQVESKRRKMQFAHRFRHRRAQHRRAVACPPQVSSSADRATSRPSRPSEYRRHAKARSPSLPQPAYRCVRSRCQKDRNAGIAAHAAEANFLLSVCHHVYVYRSH